MNGDIITTEDSYNNFVIDIEQKNLILDNKIIYLNKILEYNNDNNDLNMSLEKNILFK